MDIRRLSDLWQNPNERTGFLNPNPGTLALNRVAFLLFDDLSVTLGGAFGDSTTLDLGLLFCELRIVRRLDWISPHALAAPIFLIQSRRWPE